jgi:hypothetical protein
MPQKTAIKIEYKDDLSTFNPINSLYQGQALSPNNPMTLQTLKHIERVWLSFHSEKTFKLTLNDE